MSNIDVLKGLEFVSAVNLDPTKPEHNIAEMSEISKNSLSFEKRFLDGSPFFTWVEFSITDLCNRTCVFCPRFDSNVYPNNNEEISLELYEKIMSELASYDWQGGIVYSAFGEPLLHTQLIDLVLLTKRYLPDSFLEVVSNGDKLNVKKAKALYGAGLDMLKISLYDGPEQIPIFENMRKKLNVDEKHFVLRYRFDKDEDYGLILSNRGGSVTAPELNIKKIKIPRKKNCFFPFYKLLVDYDGRVLLCSHDWVKKLSAGDLNKQNVYEVWTSKTMKFARNRLQNKDRNFGPCAKCDVDGTLSGSSEFQRW